MKVIAAQIREMKCGLGTRYMELQNEDISAKGKQSLSAKTNQAKPIEKKSRNPAPFRALKKYK